MVKLSDIDSLNYWMEQLANRSERTKTLYKHYFLRFIEWIEKTPNQLIDMMKKTKDRGLDPRENRVLEGKVKSFMSYLESEGYSVQTQRLAYTGILSFFDHNLFPLDMSPHDRPSGEARGSRIPEKNEIVRMLNTAKSRMNRTAILFLKDSGLRVSDVVRLRWRDAKDYGEGFWFWKILTQKQKIWATSFVGPETTDALKQLDRKDERIFPVLAKALSNAVNYIAHSAGLKDVTAHGLRKFFNVELQAARVPREWRYAMMGKSTGPYDENRVSKLFETYQESYDNLRVYGSGVNAELDKVKTDLEVLRQENRVLRTRLNGMKNERNDITQDLNDLRAFVVAKVAELEKSKS